MAMEKSTYVSSIINCTIEELEELQHYVEFVYKEPSDKWVVLQKIKEIIDRIEDLG
jgi:DNA polymerase sigma